MGSSKIFNHIFRFTRTFALFFITLAIIPSANSQTSKEIFEYASPSTVLILAESKSGKRLSLGSGFFVQEDMIATNYHVIKNSSRLIIKIVGQKRIYKVDHMVISDPQKDLALLKITEVKVRPLKLGDDKQVSIGDDIFVLGNPEGLEGTFSKGNVSGIRKLNNLTYIQMSAPISGGSSGGPVLNKVGEVIGIVVSTLKTGQNLNFAIPAGYLSDIVDIVVNGKTFSSLPLQSTTSDPNKTKTETSTYENNEISKCLSKVRLAPKSAEAHFELAESYRKWGHYLESVQSYNKAIHLKANFEDAYYGLAEVQKKSLFWNENWKRLTRGEFEARLQASENAYKSAIRINPDHTKAHVGLANIYLLTERDAEALSSINLAVSLEPSSSWLYEELGSIHKSLGNITQAIEAYSTAVSLNNERYNTSAKLELARLFLEAGENDKAIENYKHILEIQKFNSEAYLELCEAIKRAGRLSEGIRYFSDLAKSAATEDTIRRAEYAERRKNRH